MIDRIIFVFLAILTIWFVNSYYNVLKNKSPYMDSIRKTRIGFIMYLVLLLGAAMFPTYSLIATFIILFLYIYFLILSPLLLYRFSN